MTGYDSIISGLRREIAQYDKAENRINYQRFFRERLKEPVGLKTPVLRRISNQCFKDVKALPAGDILNLCDDMLDSGYRYMKFFAFEWALKVKGEYRKADYKRFESWLKKFVDGWGNCDLLCCGPVGHIILKYPQLAVNTRQWAKSKNIWLRRAAAVSLIVPVRSGAILDEVFDTADRLLTDKEDLVQKGYGWLLKEASKVYRYEVYVYIMNRKDRMPRTALRYAIEKMPTDMRKKAVA